MTSFVHANPLSEVYKQSQDLCHPWAARTAIFTAIGLPVERFNIIMEELL